MSWTTISMSLRDNSNKTSDTNMNRFPVQGGLHSYKSIETQYKYRLDCYSPLFRVFLPPFFRGISHIIQLPLDHLHPTLVGHLSLRLSTCPIRQLLQFSVSCGSLGSTVQRSSPHKYGQKSSCCASNAMVAAFPQIFLGFLPSHMFKGHVSINGVSWRITLVTGIDT